MLSNDQIRAARALLGWSQTDLADRASLSQAGIARIETGENTPNSKTLEKIHAAFEQGGIEFLENDGLRRRRNFIREYIGQEGFRQFMDHVYETAMNEGGDICLFNASPAKWYQWLGEEWYQMHAERMKKIEGRFTFRATTRVQENLFIGRGFIDYRWFKKEILNDRAFYCYGSNLAFLNFGNDNVSILVLQQKEFADGFRALFDVGWEYVAIESPQGKTI